MNNGWDQLYHKSLVARLTQTIMLCSTTTDNRVIVRGPEVQDALMEVAAAFGVGGGLPLNQGGKFAVNCAKIIRSKLAVMRAQIGANEIKQ